MNKKIINSKKLGKLEFYHYYGRYVELNGVVCRDRHGYYITVDDNDFTKFVKKYYQILLREHNKLN